jgi:hypothetical protein
MNARSTYFGQEFPSSFRLREREKERAAWNKSANILRQKLSLSQLLKAGCVLLSCPTACSYEILQLLRFLRMTGEGTFAEVSSCGHTGNLKLSLPLGTARRAPTTRIINQFQALSNI